MQITPRQSLKLSSHQIAAHGLVPNTSHQRHPLLIYRSVFPSSATASSIETHFTSVCVVMPQWRYTMYSTSHFHSTTHEVLSIVTGRAKLCFGGEDNAQRVEPTVSKGDVVIVPAGVAHRLLEDIDGGFEMVGSYPNGAHWDMCYGKIGEDSKIVKIKSLGWFDRDPVYGNDWSTSKTEDSNDH